MVVGREIHPAGLDAEQLLRQCDVRRTRRSGPGGQHRNKVETAVVIAHRVTGIRGEASERRSQPENLRAAIRRLRLNLALGVRHAVDPRRSPSALWQRRCPGGRMSVSPKHADFPALLAEALDAVFSQGADVTAAADRLGCTRSQLVKLLRTEPRALGLLNEQRAALGLRPLR